MPGYIWASLDRKVGKNLVTLVLSLPGTGASKVYPFVSCPGQGVGVALQGKEWASEGGGSQMGSVCVHGGENECVLGAGTPEFL